MSNILRFRLSLLIFFSWGVFVIWEQGVDIDVGNSALLCLGLVWCNHFWLWHAPVSTLVLWRWDAAQGCLSFGVVLWGEVQRSDLEVIFEHHLVNWALLAQLADRWLLEWNAVFIVVREDGVVIAVDSVLELVADEVWLLVVDKVEVVHESCGLA